MTLELVADTIVDRVKRSIRDDILAGRVAPGDRLRIAELSARYGVSSIPIREALRRLEGDRLVVIESHRGAVIRAVDRKIVSDMYDVRSAIEALTVRNAAARAMPSDIELLEAHALAYEKAAAAGDQAGMLAANQELHGLIGALSGNPEAARYIEQGWELIIGIRNRFGFGTTRVAAVLGEHRRLIEAIARGDQVLAVHIAQEHCEGAKQDLLRRMEAAGL
jgi:DNA-binding GntR family transcriptional regulator